MSRRAQENLVTLLIIGILIAAIVAAMDYGPRARLVPIPIAVIGLVMAAGQLFLQNFRPSDNLNIDLMDFVAKRSAEIGVPTDETAAAGLSPEEADALGRKNFMREIMAFGIVGLLLFMFWLVGPLVSAFVFTAGYFMISRHFSVVMSLISAFAFAASVYVIFSVWLDVNMMDGYFDLSFGVLR